MIAVITGTSVILGICVVSMQTLWRVAAQSQAQRSAAAAFARLAEQFREDVHGGDGDGMQLSGAIGVRLVRDARVTVAYEVHPGRVDRIESVGGKAARRESYVLGRDRSVRFERRDDGPRRFLALVLVHEGRKGRHDPPKPIEVLALVGKDRIEPTATRKGAPAR